MQENSLVKIIPWFGNWPEWFELFLESCRHNPDIQWLFFTDAAPPANSPDNVCFRVMSFEKYKALVSERLEINFNPTNPYKLCDIKPALGYIHYDEIRDYDFYAFGDVDVIYGQIRNFITDAKLKRFDVISTHEKRISGHFCILRNVPYIRKSFMKVKGWKQHLENPQHLSFDESHFTKVFLPHRKHPKWLRKIWSISSKYQRCALFKEQFSTILSPIKWRDGTLTHPKTWLWKRGQLTNTKDQAEYMYLHFMNFKSRTWLPKSIRHLPAAWEKLDKLKTVSTAEAKNRGFSISPSGFTAIDAHE